MVTGSLLSNHHLTPARSAMISPPTSSTSGRPYRLIASAIGLLLRCARAEDRLPHDVPVRRRPVEELERHGLEVAVDVLEGVEREGAGRRLPLEGLGETDRVDHPGDVLDQGRQLGLGRRDPRSPLHRRVEVEVHATLGDNALEDVGEAPDLALLRQFHTESVETFRVVRVDPLRGLPAFRLVESAHEIECTTWSSERRLVRDGLTGLLRRLLDEPGTHVLAVPDPLGGVLDALEHLIHADRVLATVDRAVVPDGANV